MSEGREGIRLQRFLAEAGIASRRKAEDLIREGRVEVNGEVARVGAVVDPDRDRVRVDGETVHRPAVRLYLVMNKPRGVICAAFDPQRRPTVTSLLPRLPARVHSVGRLDFHSEGVLIFTNDGDLSRALAHPSSQVPRVYHVKVQGRVPEAALSRLRRGVSLDRSGRPAGPRGGLARCASCKVLRRSRPRPEPGRDRTHPGGNTWVEVTLTEGRYREVRRMFEALRLTVLRLRRVRFGPVSLGDLKPGRCRPLAEAEVAALRACVVGRGPVDIPSRDR